ncbi:MULTISPECIES: hypothetical protein [unclassified Cryobacterium]|uniref:hypothetical protein n=1 Tax=unclassified Cryobacterium TaxID=2649013 RepID=UPI000CE4A881|nr:MULTISPECIES: hypothetical protein [unclassified Cryobacterium]
MVTAFVMVAVTPLALVFNVIMVIVLKIPGNTGPGTSSHVGRLAGTLPYPIPAWTALLCAVSFAALLMICWMQSSNCSTRWR